MLRYVESHDVREYAKETGFSFSDADLAAIIHHSKLPPAEKHGALLDLAGRTEDSALRQQIEEHITRVEVRYEQCAPEKGLLASTSSTGQFERRFVKMPNPFEKGNIVRTTRDGRIGVVTTSQAEWRDFLRRAEEKGLDVDFSDASIIVEFQNADGSWGHRHIQPIYLERAQGKFKALPDDGHRKDELIEQ